MNKQLSDTDLIERYLDGSLNDEELNLFNERTKTDKSLNDALAERIRFQKSYIEASKQLKLKSNIKLVVSKQKRKASEQRKVWFLAASFLILAGIGSFLYLQNKPSANNPIAKQENQNQQDQVVTGKENKIGEFGSVDEYNNPDKNSEFFLPADGAVFNQHDTILFSRENAFRNEILIITNKTTGSISKKVTIESGFTEYKVFPYSLKPGLYTWSLSRDSVAHSFRIK